MSDIHLDEFCEFLWTQYDVARTGVPSWKEIIYELVEVGVAESGVEFLASEVEDRLKARRRVR